MNAHAQVRVTQAQIARALSILELCPGLELDEQLKLSTLEGETDLNELVSSLLAANEDDEGMIEAIKAQIDTRKQRMGRFEHRIETRKSAIISLMDTAMLAKLTLPEATVSMRALKPRPKVVDAEQLPAEFTRTVTTTSPDMKAIEEAFEGGKPLPRGVVLTNGGASLTVRRK